MEKDVCKLKNHPSWVMCARFSFAKIKTEINILHKGEIKMKTKKLFSLFAIVLVFGIVMIGFSLSNVDSKAIGATAVTLTDTEGTQTVLVAATETAT